MSSQAKSPASPRTETGSGKAETASQRVLIFGPTPGDSAVSQRVLADLDVETRVCHSLADLCQQVRFGAGAALVAEEHLVADAHDQLVAVLAEQPAWSDFPLIVLLSHEARASHATSRLQTLGSVTPITRPVRIAAFVSTIQSSLRDRARQYAVRDLLAERAAANASMRRKERRLSMALAAGGMATWEWRRSGLYWSKELYAMLGLDHRTTPSMDRFFACVHPEDLPVLRRAWQQTVQAGESYHGEFRVVHADGHCRWLNVVGEAIHDPDGTITRVTGLQWDITERKTVELREKRRAELEQFMAEASLVLSSSLDYGETLGRITQLCVPTLADWAFLDLIESDGSVRRARVAHADPNVVGLASHIAQYPATEEIMEHPAATGLFGGKGFVVPEFTADMLRRSAQNEEHLRVMQAVNPTSFVVVPLIARSTRLGALTLVSTNSNRRYGSEDLHIAEELSRRASVAVDNARLYEEGQQANAAKSEFVANMSHEIRTPMTAVLGYTDLLTEIEDNPEKLEFLNTIRRNGHFLLDIINDILDLSKIEAGKMEISREPFAVQDIVTDVHSMMSVRAAEKKVDFTVEFAGRVPRQIESDPKRLRQILVNLIGNAVKFTEKGNVHLIVRYLDQEQPPRMQFEVTDTGIGMSAHQQTQLFQSFSQGDMSVTRSFGGTGLGLAISQRLAKMLGGKISVASEEGKGSTFRCEIIPGDVAQDSLSETHLPPSVGLQEKTSAATTLSCRVLVVDDRRDVRFLTSHLLAKAGAEVEFATDGIEALEHVQQRQFSGASFDLILLDMQMPRLDGYETASRLRQMGFRRPIIALTADAMHGDMSRCLENGCDGYLSKPIDAGELLKTVARHTQALHNQ